MVSHSQAEIDSLAGQLAAEFPLLPLASLSQYLAEIVEWNDRVGLVSKQTTLPTVGRLVRQSALLYDFLRGQSVMRDVGVEKVVDIGSGAGFPGVVWKLMQPALALTLVERRQKKATFLRRIPLVLGLEGVEVVEGTAEEVASYEWLASKFDVATSFAVASPDAIAGLVEPFVRPGGHYCTLTRREHMAPPGRMGNSLSLVVVSDSEFGRYCLYRRAENARSTPTS